jgi:hypothetical protein
MAQLNDSMAKQIMGEIDDLTKRIDATSIKVGEQIEQTHKSAGQFINEINKLTGAAVENTKNQVNLGLVAAIHNMGPQIGEALVDHAKALHQVDRVKWISCGVAVVAVVLSFVGWIGHTSGFEAGKAAGYAAAADEKAKASWGNTDQGRMAYELAQAGSLEILANCNGRGWKLSKNTCSPLPYEDGKDKMVAGWAVGKSANGTPARKINVSWLDYIFGSAA